MPILVHAGLMVFAAAAFAGAGSCAALLQQKLTHDGARDPGLRAVTVLLAVFGALCAGATGSAVGIPAVALPLGLAGYAVAARRAGLFSIQTGELESRCIEGSELHT